MSSTSSRSFRSAALLLVALGGCTLNPPRFAPEETAGLPAQTELTQVPFFPQKQYQCGPAALATVLRNSGAAGSPDELASEVYLPGRKGSLQVELVAAARMRDRMAYEVAKDLPSLMREVAAGSPVLVMQNLGVQPIPIWHYAVVVGYDLDAGTLVLRSGTTERRVMGMRRFMSTWNRAQRWGLVVMEPGQLPAGAQLDRYVAAAAGLEAVGRLEAADQAYARAHQQWPESAWPQLGLANVSYRRGDRQAAEGGYLATLAARSAQCRRPQQSRGDSQRSRLRRAGPRPCGAGRGSGEGDGARSCRRRDSTTRRRRHDRGHCGILSAMTLKVGILETGSPPPPLQDRFGSYSTMVRGAARRRGTNSRRSTCATASCPRG